MERVKAMTLLTELQVARGERKRSMMGSRWGMHGLRRKAVLSWRTSLKGLVQWGEEEGT